MRANGLAKSNHPRTGNEREESKRRLRIDLEGLEVPVVDAEEPRAKSEREIELSKTEFDLLELLLRNQGIVLDHSTIYDRIWGYDFGPDSKNLAVYISYLRRKLEGETRTKLIHTVRGVGYTARES